MTTIITTRVYNAHMKKNDLIEVCDLKCFNAFDQFDVKGQHFVSTKRPRTNG